MNNMRFQVLALFSVTVALVLGAVIGKALHATSPALSPVRDQVGDLQARNQALQAQLRQLTTSAAGSDPDAVVEQLAPGVLDHRLDDVSVLVLSTPGGASAVPGVAHMLDVAGADVVGRLQLSDAFSDPGHAAGLLDLATSASPPSVKGDLPVTSDGVVAASALLAEVLYPVSVEADERRSVLTAYASQGYVTGVDTVTGQADAVVLITGGPAGPTDALLTLVAQLHKAGPVVVAAGQEQSTVVGRIMADADLSGTVSTVDNIGSPVGKLECAWVLVDALAGRTGAYGQSRLPPIVAATATPSPTPTPTSSR